VRAGHEAQSEGPHLALGETLTGLGLDDLVAAERDPNTRAPVARAMSGTSSTWSKWV
jgi:hypothetical protein